MNLEEFHKANYKKLMIIPVVILIISLFIIYNHYSKTNDFFDRDVSLKGGISATISTDKSIDLNKLQDILASKFKDASVRKLSEFGSDKQTGIVVEIPEIEEEELKSALEEQFQIKLTPEIYSVEITGSSLGSSFYSQMLKAMLFAFILMALSVFIIFRSPIPCLAVVFAAFTDIVATIAIVNLLEIKVSSAGISAFLLLIGYSVDTDILQTTKMMKRIYGTLHQRIISAMKTGLTMTVTSTAAVLVGYFLTNSEAIKQMFFIILIGLLIDPLTTYLMNTGLIKWYMERKHGQTS